MQCNRRRFLKTAGLAGASLALPEFSCAHSAASQNQKSSRLPNIVYILADDMGCGDVAYLNKDGKIPTPNMDRLAGSGMVFTDAHSGSAVCTPTRYGILTGRYCWRSRLKSGVLGGYSPALIESDRMTVASLLKQHGYTTACIGKWHLGLTGQETDYSKPLRPGPNDLGFDYFFGIAASLDMPPYCYIENDKPTTAPTDDIEGSPSPAFWRGGKISPDFKHSEVQPTLTKKAIEFINANAGKSPLFVYLPFAAPHTPIVPTPEFIGKSGVGVYGDFVCQVDHSIGRIIDTLKKNNLTENTLVILTSDNGCSPQADFKALAEHGHYPSYHFRGYKADIFEGGHRIPFIARWPRKIKPSTTCDETICLTDLLATTADIVGDRLPDNAGPDSVSILPALLGKNLDRPLREATVHHSINGSFSIRQGRWKLELCPGSGGWSSPRPAEAKKMKLPPIQLYDLSADIGETKNVCKEHPDVVEHLTALLEKYKQQGRSTPIQGDSK
jgi:arylsulfatase A-like enzyme